jgi:hypothetical protein
MTIDVQQRHRAALARADRYLAERVGPRQAPPGAVCACGAARHEPELHGIMEYHHVWPLYMGGPPKGEQVWLGGSEHNTVHAIIRAFLRAGHPLTRYRVLPGERPRRQLYDLALRGYAAWGDAGYPPVST